MKYLITLALLCSVNFAWAATITGRVVGIADGDTITVLDNTNTQYKIRLSGIDAPEKKQDFGNASKKTLSELVFNKQVTVDWTKEDRYGRIVGKVLLNGVDINLQQVKTGMAWFYRKYQSELTQDDRMKYLHAEEDAIERRVGLWQLANPVAPWDFRKARR
jgi:endonuclease YncB( thermonuclease family)